MTNSEIDNLEGVVREQIKDCIQEFIVKGLWAIGLFALASIGAYTGAVLWVNGIANQVERNREATISLRSVVADVAGFAARQSRMEATLSGINERTLRIERQIDGITYPDGPGR